MSAPSEDEIVPAPSEPKDCGELSEPGYAASFESGGMVSVSGGCHVGGGAGCAECEETEEV